MTNPLTPQVIAELANIDTATVSNGLNSLEEQDPTRGFGDWTIRCLFPDLPPMVGYAVTVTMDTVTPGHSFDVEAWLSFVRAVEAAPKPAIVVMQDVGPDVSRSCHGGDCMTLLVQKMGGVGIVTNGGFRDLKDIEPLRFPVFASGCVPSSGTNRIVETDVPVTVGGMYAESGDLIHGDASGVINVPVELASRTVAAAQDMINEENRYREFVRSVDFSVDKYEKFMRSPASGS